MEHDNSPADDRNINLFSIPKKINESLEKIDGKVVILINLFDHYRHLQKRVLSNYMNQNAFKYKHTVVIRAHFFG
jgi:Mg2+ and Co2+ transporter CorA